MKVLMYLYALAATCFYIHCTRSSGSPLIPTAPSFDDTPTFITTDQANRMIQSYLTSINYPQRNYELRAVSVNADSLRQYLNDTSIRRIQIMIAHRMDYIKSGGEGKKPPYGKFGLTAIVAGLNSSNNYVYHIGNVMDNSLPCPDMCASSALLE